jgi:outer membrane protein TolC
LTFRTFLFLTSVSASALVPAYAQEGAPPAPAPPRTTAVQTQALTFQQALQRALEANPGIGRSTAEIRYAVDQQKQLFSALLPRINANGSGIRNSEEVQFGNGADAQTVLPANDWNAHIVLTQPIYAGNRERRAYDQAKLNVRNAQQGQTLTQDQVLLRVASNYLAVVDADQLIAIEQKNTELAQSRRKQASAFYEAGESTKVDVLRADTAIKAAQRALAGAQQARESAIGRLRLDLSLDGNFELVRPSTPVPALPEENVLVDRAAATRPEVVQAQNNLTIAQLEVRKQRGAYLPVVSAEAGYNAQRSAFPAQRYGYGAIRFSVPIFTAGETSYRIASAREREKQAQLALDEARLTVREDVRKGLTDLRAAETSLALAKEQLNAAEAEYAQSFELYRAQEATSLDVSVSETSLAEARRAVAEETLNRDLAALRVWYAAGDIKQATLMESK